MTKKPIGIALIPAYEPSRLLLTLLQEICASGMTALVVNDGSSPQSRFVFQEAEEYATVLTHEQNLGKGRAIKTGLSYLKERFWDQEYVVVTVDADGQHRVEDAIRVCQAAARSPDTLILGSRKFEGEVPARSRFGNTATRIAYRLATGVPVTDTQTGLRAFHKHLLPQMLSILSSGFEIFFEKSPKRIAVRKVNQATSASCKAIASLAIRAFTSSSCVCFAFSAGIALTTKIVPPILSTKPVFISSTVITSLRKNRGVRFRTPRYQPKKDYSFS